MGLPEDNEQEIGRMTLERLAMRRQIAEEAVRTAELRVEAAQRLAELREQEAQIRNAAQNTMSPPALSSAPQSTRSNPVKKEQSLLSMLAPSFFGSMALAAGYAYFCYRLTPQLYTPYHTFGWWWLWLFIGAFLLKLLIDSMGDSS